VSGLRCKSGLHPTGGGEYSHISVHELGNHRVEEAQRVLAEYLEPGALRSAVGTIHKLASVLDRPELAAALERMKADRGLRLVK
jgi:hypothetical protein